MGQIAGLVFPTVSLVPNSAPIKRARVCSDWIKAQHATGVSSVRVTMETAHSMLILRMAVLMLLLELTEAKPMEIITSKADVEVGSDYFLLCKAGGEGEISWHKDGEMLEEGVEKFDESSSKLTVRNARLEDAGRYICMCDFDLAPKDSVSYQIYVYEPLSFGSTPVHHEFLAGEEAVMACEVTGRPEVDVQWTRGGVVVRPDGGRVRVLSDSSLQITDVRRTDAGLYVCEGSIRGRSLINKQLNITVTVNVQPTVKFREQVKSVMAGPQTLSLLCVVEGHPQPDITWTTPITSDPSRHRFNPDRSELTLTSVLRGDSGEYVCTARNKIGQDSATIRLDVSERPEVILSRAEEGVEPGQSVSVGCNVTGHPAPALLWVSSSGRLLNSSVGRVRVEQGYLLVVERVAPPDGGVYRCVALGASGNASRDFSLRTHPGPPSLVSAAPGSTSILLSLGGPQVDGGSPITHYALQWRRGSQDPWREAIIGARDKLVITSLQPYTSYSLRLAAKNRLGQGGFSNANIVRTKGIQGEPDRPELSSEARVNGNSFSVPFQQLDDGGSPITHYLLRYRAAKEGEGWTEKRLPSDSRALQLRDLQYDTGYQLELLAVNGNGSSTSTKMDFSTAQPPPVPQSTKVGKGGVVGIVMVLFLALLLAVDVTCCYRNRCGLLMFLSGRLCAQKVPGLKTLEEGDSGTIGKTHSNGDPAHA